MSTNQLAEDVELLDEIGAGLAFAQDGGANVVQIDAGHLARIIELARRAVGYETKGTA